MAAFLGLRGVGDWTADERPKNWREMILHLFPNGEAPLTAVLSLLKSEMTDDPEYNWWEKRLPTQRLQVNGSQTSGDTTIEVDSGAKDCVAGTLLLHETSGEILRVTSDPSADTSFECERSFGAVVAGAFSDNDFLVIIGNVNEDGGNPPTPISYSPTKVYNYSQIFRKSLSMTRRARKQTLRWDNRGPYREAKREALSLHSIEIEKAFTWGEAIEATGPGGKLMHTTKGLVNYLTTNINGSYDLGGALLDEPTLDTLLEGVFRYGSNEKLALCGSTFLRTITTLGKRNGTLTMTPSSTTYGMKIVEYLTPFGTLYLKSHPLYNQHSEWRKNCLILDTNNLGMRMIDDTKLIKNRQNPGADLSLDEYFSDFGTELHYEETHAYIENVGGPLIS